MCLALPARIDEKNGIDAWITLGDTRMRTSLIMTPEAEVGDWVLVHAGFAIQTMSEADAKETWQLIESVSATDGSIGS